MREAKNLKDTNGIELVTEVMSIQVKLINIATVTGCPNTFLFIEFSNKILKPKKTAAIVINISEGRDKSKDKPLT
jgi:hypothetical protein